MDHQDNEHYNEKPASLTWAHRSRLPANNADENPLLGSGLFGWVRISIDDGFSSPLPLTKPHLTLINSTICYPSCGYCQMLYSILQLSIILLILFLIEVQKGATYSTGSVVEFQRLVSWRVFDHGSSGARRRTEQRMGVAPAGERDRRREKHRHLVTHRIRVAYEIFSVV